MTTAHPAACPFALKAQSVSAIPSGTQASVHQENKSGGLRHVVEVSPLLTHMPGASDVSSHSSGAFPSGGFDLHIWPGLWSGLFLAREKKAGATTSGPGRSSPLPRSSNIALPLHRRTEKCQSCQADGLSSPARQAKTCTWPFSRACRSLRSCGLVEDHGQSTFRRHLDDVARQISHIPSPIALLYALPDRRRVKQMNVELFAAMAGLDALPAEQSRSSLCWRETLLSTVTFEAI